MHPQFTSLRAGLQSRDATVSELRCAVDEGRAELEATSARAATTLEAHAHVESRLRELRESSARLGARANQAEEEAARLRSLKAEAADEAAAAHALTTEARHELAAVRNELGARLLRLQQEMAGAEEGWRRAAADEERQLEVRVHMPTRAYSWNLELPASASSYIHACPCCMWELPAAYPATLQRAGGREREPVPGRGGRRAGAASELCCGLGFAFFSLGRVWRGMARRGPFAHGMWLRRRPCGADGGDC